MTTPILSVAVAWQVKAHAFERALREARAAIAAAETRANPNWHLQPRLPRGHPDGGRWTREGDAEVVPAAIPPAVIALLLAVARVSRFLRRLPRPMASPPQPELPEGMNFGPPSVRRPEHPYFEFDTFQQFKDVFGDARPNYQWHHIVEQRHVAAGRFSPRQIHNTDNIIEVPINVHTEINRQMSRRFNAFSRITSRKWLENKNFEEQYQYGLMLLEKNGVE